MIKYAKTNDENGSPLLKYLLQLSSPREIKASFHPYFWIDDDHLQEDSILQNKKNFKLLLKYLKKIYTKNVVTDFKRLRKHFQKCIECVCIPGNF